MLARCSACSHPRSPAQDTAPGGPSGRLGRGSQSPGAPLDGLAVEASRPGPLWMAWPRKPVTWGPSAEWPCPCVVSQHEWPASSVLLYTVCSLGCFHARCVSKSRLCPDGSVQPLRGWVQGAVPVSCLETAACHSITKTGLWGTRAQVDCVVVFLRSLGMFLRGS